MTEQPRCPEHRSHQCFEFYEKPDTPLKCYRMSCPVQQAMKSPEAWAKYMNERSLDART